jgi:hypothetical protein
MSPLSPAALALIAGALCAAVPAVAQRIVPIEEEPRHQLKFQNAHVRFFDVQLPPGYEGVFHTHVHDGVFVNIEASETRAQDLGGPAEPRPPRIVGDAYFTPYTSKPKAHKVDNIGAATYRVTDTEIHMPCGGFKPAPDGVGQTLIVENDRVRVTRLMVGPGERAALHPTCAMLVAVSGGRLRFLAPGGDEDVTLAPAGFKWRDQRTPLSFVNTGTEVFHGVDIVVK